MNKDVSASAPDPKDDPAKVPVALPDSAHKLVPSGTWKMASKTMSKLGVSPQLTSEERQAAILAYLKDEPGRNNRMGGTLLGVGASIGGGSSLFTIMESVTELNVGLNLLLVGGTVAFVIVGQFAKLSSAHRDGVGLMIVAILEYRQAQKEDE